MTKGGGGWEGRGGDSRPMRVGGMPLICSWRFHQCRRLSPHLFFLFHLKRLAFIYMYVCRITALFTFLICLFL